MSGETDLFQIAGIRFIFAVEYPVDFFQCGDFRFSAEYGFINFRRRGWIPDFLKIGKGHKHQPVLIQFRDDLIDRNSHKVLSSFAKEGPPWQEDPS